jgi:hypothetical protein
MTAITIDIPNADVGFFTKMISKMGWSLSGASITKRPATGKEKTLKKIDHAFGQLRQMQDGSLKGVTAESIIDEL